MDGHISANHDFGLGLKNVLSDLAYGWFAFLTQIPGGKVELYLTIFLCACFLVRQVGKRKMDSMVTWVFLLLPLVFLVFFSFHAAFLPRYFLAAYPFFVLFILSQAWALSRWVAILLVALALVTNPRRHYELRADLPAPYPSGFEYSMNYADMIRLHQEMGRHLDFSVTSKSKILTGWPFIYTFVFSDFGYIKKDLVDAQSTNSPNDADYIIDGSCLSFEDRKSFVDLLPGFTKIQEFTRPGMWVTLYENTKKRELGRAAR